MSGNGSSRTRPPPCAARAPPSPTGVSAVTGQRRAPLEEALGIAPLADDVNTASSSANTIPPVPSSARAPCSATACPTCSGVAAPAMAEVTFCSAVNARSCVAGSDGPAKNAEDLPSHQSRAGRVARSVTIGGAPEKPRGPAPVAAGVGRAGRNHAPFRAPGEASLHLDGSRVAAPTCPHRRPFAASRTNGVGNVRSDGFGRPSAYRRPDCQPE